MRLFRERGGLRPRAAAPGIIAVIPANTGLVRWNGGTTTPVHHGRRGRPAAVPGTMMQTGKKMGSESIDWRSLLLALPLAAAQIGRASCRDRESQYVWISVVAGLLKKKKNTISTTHVYLLAKKSSQ